jgi:uncharacterized protein
MDVTDWLLPVAFFAAALLYSSVGHAGASGYLAVMALAGVVPATMRPTALVLNLIVASIATTRFARAGYFSWSLLWPFALGSIPFAFVGGAITLPVQWYRVLVGFVLWVAAFRMWQRADPALDGAREHRLPSVPTAVVCGTLIGLLAGLTGTGGGIFLSPLLLFTGWADTRRTGGVSAAFIWVNSAAGLAGNLQSLRAIPTALPVWAVAVVLGGFVGSDLGSRRVGVRTFRRLLAVVLIVAGGKLISGR